MCYGLGATPAFSPGSGRAVAIRHPKVCPTQTSEVTEDPAPQNHIPKGASRGEPQAILDGKPRVLRQTYAQNEQGSAEGQAGPLGKGVKGQTGAPAPGLYEGRGCARVKRRSEATSVSPEAVGRDPRSPRARHVSAQKARLA